MAFGRQGVTGAERSRDGTARFDRLGESHVEKPRDDDTLADGSTCGGATGRSRPRDPPTPGETEPNRTEPERPGSLLWKGSPAVYGGRGRHLNKLTYGMEYPAWRR